jgi:dehydrogenase/reductase SDR family protein 12
LLGTLENVNYVITGANSGLGLAAAIFAASRKAKVYIVCRNPQRGEEAVKQIIEKSNNKDVHLILG